MKNKNIKLINSPIFYYNGDNIFYDLEDIKDKGTMVTKVITGKLKGRSKKKQIRKLDRK